MLRKLTLLNLFLLVAMLFAACTPAANTPDAMMATTPTDAMMDQPTKTADAMMQPTSAMMDQGTPAADAMMQPTDSMMDTGTAAPTADAMMDQSMGTPTIDAMMQPTESIPSTGMNDAMMASWTAKELTNPASGKTFKIDDFKGKVVLVDLFAQQCSNCLAQQQELVKLHKLMGMNSDLISISLDIDANENATLLKTYLEQHSFDWNFALAPAEVSQEISKLYGSQFLNPASAPMLIIDQKGVTHPLPFGIKSAEDLQKALEPYLKTGM